ncbi:MAG TPA: ABC transporter permease, partial [Gemmatimonadaceae bacterium]
MPRRLTDWRRAPFWPLPAEREVDEELADHLELQTRRYVAAGMSPDAARAAALRRFGNVAGVRDECHTIRHQMEADVRRSELVHDLRQDAAFAVRTLRASRGFAVVALLTLAIGIGATTAIFSVVSSVLLRALPYTHADRVVTIANGSADPTQEPMAVAPPEFADIHDQSRALDHVVALQPQPAALVGDGEPERVNAYAVSPDLFDMLGARPALGRGFVADDGAEGSPGVVLLSHVLWQRRYGGDSTVVGRTVTLAGVPRTIVGVMPPGVRFPDAPVGYLRDRADLWVPYDWMRRRSEDRGNQYLVVLARARQGSSPSTVLQDVAAIAERFRQDYPDRYQGSLGGGRWRLAVTPLREEMLGGVRRPLVVLTAAVALVLLMGCVNVAGLMLARAQARRREMSVRLALGAGRGRLVRQLLTESAILALGGGVLGTALAWAGVRLLVALDPGGIPRLGDTRLDGATLLFALGASLACGLLFGILPALQQSRADLRGALGDDARGATGGRRAARARAVLVAAEVAMAVVVLVGAALLARSFATLQRVEPGFAPRGVLSLQLSIPRQTYDSAHKVGAFYERAVARLAALPGVAGAALVDIPPLSSSYNQMGTELAGGPTGDE